MTGSVYHPQLLELDGEDWRPRPLEERKDGDGAAIFAHAQARGGGYCLEATRPPVSVGAEQAVLKTKNPSTPGMLRFREEP